MGCLRVVSGVALLQWLAGWLGWGVRLAGERWVRDGYRGDLGDGWGPRRAP